MPASRAKLLKGIDMKTALAALLASLLCAGCAYQLGSVQTKPGSTDTDRDVDLLTCTHEAEVHGGADAAEWIPFAGYAVSKQLRRNAFKDCMERKNYTVIPPQ